MSDVLPPASPPRRCLALIGAPGAGKSSAVHCVLDQGGSSVAHFGVKKFALDLIRRQRPEVRPMHEAVLAGRVLPDEDVRALLEIFLREEAAASDRVLVEGYPRSLRQHGDLRETLCAAGVGLAGLVVVAIDDETSVRRTRSRTACGRCAMPSAPNQTSLTCTSCGARMERRADDELTVLRARLADYRRTERDLRGLFGADVFEVDGCLPPEGIADELARLLEITVLQPVPGGAR